jgi:hypothetical protein
MAQIAFVSVTELPQFRILVDFVQHVQEIADDRDDTDLLDMLDQLRYRLANPDQAE